MEVLVRYSWCLASRWTVCLSRQPAQSCLYSFSLRFSTPKLVSTLCTRPGCFSRTLNREAG